MGGCALLCAAHGPGGLQICAQFPESLRLLSPGLSLTTQSRTPGTLCRGEAPEQDLPQRRAWLPRDSQWHSLCSRGAPCGNSVPLTGQLPVFSKLRPPWAPGLLGAQAPTPGGGGRCRL